MRGAFLAAVVGLGALTGCRAIGLSGPEERWQDVRITGVGVDDLWTVVTTSLNQSGFRRVDIDRAAGSGTTGWDVSLYPYTGGGWRERAHVRVEPAGERAWKLGVRVEREKNETVKRTLDEKEAKWEPEADDEERARIVARRVVAALGFSESRASGR